MIQSTLTYAIGDVHGCDDLLGRALETLHEHARGQTYRIVLLGDYIDRGPDSARVVARLIALQKAMGTDAVVCLRGNHEQLCLNALEAGGGWELATWRRFGGAETLASYARAGRRGRLADIPPEHREWLSGLPLILEDGDRVFVHAGLQPRLPLAEQDPGAFLWIREPFLTAHAGEFLHHVVHGHTPNWEEKPNWEEVERFGHRTNLDTGAYRTGVLSVGVFHPDGKGPSAVLSVEGGERTGASVRMEAAG